MASLGHNELTVQGLCLPWGRISADLTCTALKTESCHNAKVVVIGGTINWCNDNLEGYNSWFSVTEIINNIFLYFGLYLFFRQISNSYAHKCPHCDVYIQIDGLVQGCSYSIVNSLELLQFCIKLLVYAYMELKKLWFQWNHILTSSLVDNHVIPPVQMK